MESRVALLEQIAAKTAATLERIELRIDSLDRRMDGFERRMDAFERRLEMLDARRHNDFKWILSVMFAGFSATFAGFAGMFGLMAHGFHWL